MGFFLDALFRERDGDEREARIDPVPGDDAFTNLTNRQLLRDEALRVTLETFRAGIAPDREHEIRVARTRWLEEHRAVASFPCGIAVGSSPTAAPDPDPWGERAVQVVPVTVAVLQQAFVFLREGTDEPGTEPLVEVGRFRRAAFVSTHLEDASGARVAGRGTDR